jgi:hypothetical protein
VAALLADHERAPPVHFRLSSGVPHGLQRSVNELLPSEMAFIKLTSP